MRKLLPVSTGIFTGLAVAIAMIVFSQSPTAYGEEDVNWWNDIVARSETFEWEDVFAPFGHSEKGKDLYNLVYSKLNRKAEQSALLEIAGKYGLTTDEARVVLSGSVTPILNNPDRRGALLRQEDAYLLMDNLREEYETISELFQIEQEVDTAISPSEIFANGDLSDSGFDLIHDLSVIEEILFLEFTPSSVGAPYENAITSPYDPTLTDDALRDFVGSETAVARLPLAVNPETGEEVAVDVLEDDVCEVDNTLLDALNNFENATLEEDSGSIGPGGAVGSGRLGSDGPGADGPGAASDSVGPADDIEPAAADEWLKTWCPGLAEEGASSSAGAAFSPEKLRSLGGAGPFAGASAGASFNTGGFSAQIAACLEIQMIRETVSSYQPGDSCIKCEVEQILELMDKTLSHTLMPNKATGNILESAKCKNSDVLLNLQFITIWNPIPAPVKDDLIFGKNIFEEWNSFTERYQPILLDEVSFDIEDRPDISQNFSTQYQTTTAPAGTTQAEIFDQINATKARFLADAVKEIEDFDLGNEATDLMVYSRSVLQEMRQMNALFRAFNGHFEKIAKEACPGIKSKGNVD